MHAKRHGPAVRSGTRLVDQLHRYGGAAVVQESEKLCTEAGCLLLACHGREVPGPGGLNCATGPPGRPTWISYCPGGNGRQLISGLRPAARAEILKQLQR